MPIETNALAVFASVVKHGTFARAAQEHQMTASGVSRVISRLEGLLGVRLLQRSTRRLSLTEAGDTFHQRALRILADLEEAQAEASMAGEHVKGTLKLNVPTVFGRQHIVPLLPALRKKYPELFIDLHLTDDYVDLIEEGVDLAVRIGSLEDSRLIARRLCANRRLLVASPEYLQEKGEPQSPEDLEQHQCLVFTALEKPYQWRLQGPNGKLQVTPKGAVVCNNGEALTLAAKEHLGIALGATFSVWQDLAGGHLVRVLPDYEFEETAIHAIYPSSRQLSRKVRAAVDFLVSAFEGVPKWDQQLHSKIPGFTAR